LNVSVYICDVMEVRGGGERFFPLPVCTGEETGSYYSGNFQRHRDALEGTQAFSMSKFRHSTDKLLNRFSSSNLSTRHFPTGILKPAGLSLFWLNRHLEASTYVQYYVDARLRSVTCRMLQG
jgi:hypothetical protein